MTHYKVMWEIDIFADTPQAAAQEALDTMREPGSEAVYFTTENTATGERVDVDLLVNDTDSDTED